MKIKYLSILPVIAVLVLSGASLAHAQVFTGNLYFGLKNNAQVTQLQEFLTSQNLYTGPITGNFYFLTLNAVKAFQTQQGITPAAGYFGPITKAAANKIADAAVSASNAQAISETGTSTPSISPASSTPQLQLEALLREVALLEQQLQAQQSSTQVETQTLQKIAVNTQPAPTPTPAPTPPPSPSVTTPPTISSVQATNITVNAAVITWTTNENSDSVVYYGLSSGSYYSSSQGSVSALVSGYLHTVNLSSLPVNTTFYYKVTSTDGSGNKGTSNEYSFATASPGSLTVAKNNALSNQTVLSASTGDEIGSYNITASSAEGVKVSAVTINAYPNGVGSNDLQNLRVTVNGTQFGNQTSTVADGGTYSFSGSQFTISAGGTATVNVYADVQWGAMNATPATEFLSCSATGLISGQATSQCNPSAGSQFMASGQNLTVTPRSASTIQISLASDAPGWGGKLAAGSQSNLLTSFLFTETSHNENVKITDLTITDNVSPAGALPSFANLVLYSGAVLLTNPASPVATTGGYTYSFHFGTPVIIPQSNSIELTLKGDVATVSNITDGSTHSFGIANASSVIAMGLSSNLPASVIANSFGNPIVVQPTVAFVTGTPGTLTRTQTAVDDIGTINFSAATAGSLILNTVKITFAGSAFIGSTNFYNTASAGVYNSTIGTCATCYVTLYDSANGTSYFPIASASGESLTFNMNSYQLTAGSTKSFNLRINSAQAGVFVAAGTNSAAHSLSAIISAAGNVTYFDALSGGSLVSLQPSTIPITLANASYTY